MTYQIKSAAAIHDISGVGKCSLTVVLPVLSVCGVETSVMPTAVLSTHTGGFEGFTYRELTEDLLPMARHWKQVGCEFGALYSGFLGSAAQIGIVEQIFQMFQGKETLVFVDPVMGDNGRLYRTYTSEMADRMAGLCQAADVVVPNLTEASRLLGIPYREGPYPSGYVEEVLKRLCEMGPEMAVLTGVSLDREHIGSACLDTRTGKIQFFLRRRVEGRYHGTGDLFASALLGGLLNGMCPFDACETATEFTWRCILSTRELSRDTKFGPKFEIHLPWLATRMEQFRSTCLEEK